jgi:hypothetical protein
VSFLRRESHNHPPLLPVPPPSIPEDASEPPDESPLDPESLPDPPSPLEPDSPPEAEDESPSPPSAEGDDEASSDGAEALDSVAVCAEEGDVDVDVVVDAGPFAQAGESSVETGGVASRVIDGLMRAFGGVLRPRKRSVAFVVDGDEVRRGADATTGVGVLAGFASESTGRSATRLGE